MKLELEGKQMKEEDRKRIRLKINEMIDEINKCELSPLVMAVTLEALLHIAVDSKKERALGYLDVMAEKIQENKNKLWE